MLTRSPLRSSLLWTTSNGLVLEDAMAMVIVMVMVMVLTMAVVEAPMVPTEVTVPTVTVMDHSGAVAFVAAARQQIILNAL